MILRSDENQFIEQKGIIRQKTFDLGTILLFLAQKLPVRSGIEIDAICRYFETFLNI